MPACSRKDVPPIEVLHSIPTSPSTVDGLHNIGSPLEILRGDSNLCMRTAPKTGEEEMNSLEGNRDPDPNKLNDTSSRNGGELHSQDTTL